MRILIYRELYVCSVSSGMEYGDVLIFAGVLKDSKLGLKSHAICWDYSPSLLFQSACDCKVAKSLKCMQTQIDMVYHRSSVILPGSAVRVVFVNPFSRF